MSANLWEIKVSVLVLVSVDLGAEFMVFGRGIILARKLDLYFGAQKLMLN